MFKRKIFQYSSRVGNLTFGSSGESLVFSEQKSKGSSFVKRAARANHSCHSLNKSKRVKNEGSDVIKREKAVKNFQFNETIIFK